ncbi:MAG: Glyoxalase/bleomycin resistance protein/dioxygenase [Parcubacteria group bacterium GW2011_GWA2_31_28]|nr:MAG: Glyoxalase/bleomycin resistance protein/dioxygenase [Parcubacteria group bacterium GW2011_GWA2_31_28]
MENHLPRDPLGHIKLAVSDFKKSLEFYSIIFEKLGFKKVSQKEKSAAWVTKEGFGISIAQAEKLEPKYVFFAPGLHHLCFKALSKNKVDEIYSLLKEKTKIFDEPQAYPGYTADYYAVFFSDPDGIKLEVAYY